MSLQRPSGRSSREPTPKGGMDDEWQQPVPMIKTEIRALVHGRGEGG
jgi:hypothetical protein